MQAERLRADQRCRGSAVRRETAMTMIIEFSFHAKEEEQTQKPGVVSYPNHSILSNTIGTLPFPQPATPTDVTNERKPVQLLHLIKDQKRLSILIADPKYYNELLTLLAFQQKGTLLEVVVTLWRDKIENGSFAALWLSEVQVVHFLAVGPVGSGSYALYLEVKGKINLVL
jgi:hypothetical protein